MTAPAPGLPQDVERAIVAAMSAATDFGVDGMLAHLQRSQDAVNALRAAIAAHVAPPVSASFEEALTGLDYEVTHHPDKMVTTYTILGLDDVRAAHRAEVDRLSARVAKLEAEQSEARNRVARLEAALGFYADLDAHGARLDVYESNYTGDPADVELDRGAKARAALGDKS